MALSVRTKRFTTAEYQRMGEVGILGEDDRVELIEGEIVEMAPIGEDHASEVIEVSHLFFGKFGDVARVSVQNPILLSGDSEPQPDLVLLRPRSDRYRTGHPTPADILLLVEISDTTLSYDRDVKVPLYARTGISEVWLVDINGDTLLVFSDPSPDGYRASRIARRGDLIAPIAFPGREIAVGDVLGESPVRSL